MVVPVLSFKRWPSGHSGGATKRTNLALALRGKDEAPGLKELVILDEADPKAAVQVGYWPKDWPWSEGPAWGPYRLLVHEPLVDPVTNLVAVGAKRDADPDVSWFVLDLQEPRYPRTVARVRGGSVAAFHNGVLTVANAAHRGFVAYRIVIRAKQASVVKARTIPKASNIRR